MTQEQLAERLEVSVGYVSQVERGITKISLDLLGAISAVLSCDIASLITNSAIENNSYIVEEFAKELAALNAKNKKILLEMARLLRAEQ